MNFPFKRALVTGGAGFIGSHLVEELVKSGIDTISIDNYFAGKHENLAHLKSYSNFQEAECDVTDFENLEKYFLGVEVSGSKIRLDYLIHFLEYFALSVFFILWRMNNNSKLKFKKISPYIILGMDAVFLIEDFQKIIPLRAFIKTHKKNSLKKNKKRKVKKIRTTSLLTGDKNEKNRHRIY